MFYLYLLYMFNTLVTALGVVKCYVQADHIHLYRSSTEGLSWSIRPSEIYELLEQAFGNEGHGKEWGKENCPAGIWGHSSESVVCDFFKMH